MAIRILSSENITGSFEVSGKVGIGTAPTSRNLSVFRGTAGSVANFLHYTDASNFAGLYIGVSQSSQTVSLNASGSSGGNFEMQCGNVTALSINNSSATFAGDLSVTGGDLTLGTDSIASNINGVGDVLNINVDSNTGGGAGANIQLKTAGTTQLTINNSSSTFAGTVTATGRLTVNTGGGIAAYFNGNGSNYTQGAIALQSSDESTPEARGQGVFMYNQGTDSTWYTGTTYNNADRFIVGHATNASINTEAARINNAFLTVLNSGAVGIGVTSPSAKLHVQGAANDGLAVMGVGTTATRVFAGLDGSNHGYLFLAGSSGQNPAVISATGGNSYISGGNVGIGTTSPTLGKLQVSGKGYFGPVGTGNATTKPTMQSNAVLTLKPHDSNSTNMNFAQVNSGSGIGVQVTNGPGTANWDIALSPFGGNVGIGTASPSKKLHVKESDSATAVVKIENTIAGGDYMVMIGDAGDNVFEFDSSGTGGEALMKMYSDGVLKAQIAADGNSYFNGGNVGINTTNPIDKLNVHGGTGDAAAQQPKIAVTRTSSTGNVLAGKMILTTKPSDPTNHGNLAFQVKTTASSGESSAYYTNAITIDGKNANVGIGTASPSTNFQVKNNFFEHAVGKSHTGIGNLFTIQLGTSGQAYKGSIIVTIFGSRFSPGQNDYAGGAVYYLTRSNVGTISVVTASTTGTWQPTIDVNNTTKIWTFTSASPLGGSAGNFTSYSVTIQGIGHNGTTVINPTVTIL